MLSTQHENSTPDAVEHAEQRAADAERAKATQKRLTWAVIILCGIVVALIGYVFLPLEQQKAQQGRVTAEQVLQLCASGELRDERVCRSAQQTVEQVPAQTGQAGPAGPPGPSGPPGQDGSPGATGQQGPVGSPGAVGEQGAQGAQGQQGVQGQPGSSGAPGAPGVDGKPGVEGPAGTAGAPGVAGAPGTDGKPGESVTGPAGPAGPAGVTGPEGQAGPAGPAGPTGETGPAGAQGDPGRDGKDGRGVNSLFCSAGDLVATYTDGDQQVVMAGSAACQAVDRQTPAATPLARRATPTPTR